jgi:hypothetical protein
MKCIIFNIATSNIIVMFIVLWYCRQLNVIFVEYKLDNHAVYYVVLLIFFVFLCVCRRFLNEIFRNLDFSTLHVKYSYK